MDANQPHRWDPADAVDALARETLVMDGGDSTATAKRILKDAAPIAAASVVQLAQYATSETIRLSASKLVLERTLGGIAPSSNEGAGEDVFDSFLRKVREAAEQV